jgi:hypothetical protein
MMIANERSDARDLKDIDPPAEKRFTPIIGLKGVMWLNLIIRARGIKVNREKVTAGFRYGWGIVVNITNQKEEICSLYMEEQTLMILLSSITRKAGHIKPGFSCSN